MSHLKITQIKSAIGHSPSQRKTLRGLGLRKVRHTVVRKDTPQLRGMLNTVFHLVVWEETRHE